MGVPRRERAAGVVGLGRRRTALTCCAMGLSAAMVILSTVACIAGDEGTAASRRVAGAEPAKTATAPAVPVVASSSTTRPSPTATLSAAAAKISDLLLTLADLDPGYRVRSLVESTPEQAAANYPDPAVALREFEAQGRGASVSITFEAQVPTVAGPYPIWEQVIEYAHFAGAQAAMESIHLRTVGQGYVELPPGSVSWGARGYRSSFSQDGGQYARVSCLAQKGTYVLVLGVVQHASNMSTEHLNTLLGVALARIP